jgi:tetraacyldisaccharide 4'-kinase
MNLANYTLQSFRFILLPISILYGLIIRFRNFLYDKNILHSAKFNIPLICVGNLSVGGTGKSPMIELLIHHLSSRYKIATLSRGYKRKTKGYLLATPQLSALEIGDEPMQFYLKFPDLVVAVGEERITAIPQLLQDVPNTEVILLDDAFQHRAIKPGFSILLTDYSDLFTRDFFFPTGNLRDEKSSYKRADIIIVTKCDSDLSQNRSAEILREIRPLSGQTVLFAAMEYGMPYHILNKDDKKVLDQNTEVLLVTGIANIRPLKKYLHEQVHSYDQMTFSDHHIYDIDDMHDITTRLQKIKGDNTIIITTEKDAVRLIKFKEYLADLPIYVLPVQHKILYNQETLLLNHLHDFISSFSKTTSKN